MFVNGALVRKRSVAVPPARRWVRPGDHVLVTLGVCVGKCELLRVVPHVKLFFAIGFLKELAFINGKEFTFIFG